MADTVEAGELLDVEMDEFARPLALVAALPARVEPGSAGDRARAA